MEEKLFKELTRKERMDEMLVHVNQMLRRIHPNRGLVVNYLKMTDNDLESFSDWDRKRFVLHTGLEYFIVTEWEPGATRAYVLYVVDVSADSELTAMDELFHLLSHKF